ncbi:hypothetical protein Tco_0732384, partial [Tanacetum coccineum]
MLLFRCYLILGLLHSVSYNSVSSDSESEDEEVDVVPEATVG